MVLLLCDAKTKVLRSLVPSSQRFNIFSALHGISHPEVWASRRLNSTRFVWRGLANNVRDWCKSCLQCQWGQVLRHVHIRPEKIPVPFRRFAHVHLDLVGPLPSSHGFTYLFTCIDRSTKWPEAIPLTGISATECASTMFHGWISRFGKWLQVTEEPSSLHPYGLPSAPYSRSSTRPPQPSTLSPTAWWKGSTGS